MGAGKCTRLPRSLPRSWRQGCRASGARAALSRAATHLAGGRASPGVTELTRQRQGAGLAPWRGWHLPDMGRALGQASLGWGGRGVTRTGLSSATTRPRRSTPVHNKPYGAGHQERGRAARTTASCAGAAWSRNGQSLETPLLSRSCCENCPGAQQEMRGRTTAPQRNTSLLHQSD